ncbi:MAG: metal ABC transporter substrate-binding protein [Candidatus Lokiarchaeota archaeon]|nr:metal ABC transporter substrate-binding protein [Candidatus Lokiarchaeota archaeon]
MKAQSKVQIFVVISALLLISGAYFPCFNFTRDNIGEINLLNSRIQSSNTSLKIVATMSMIADVVQSVVGNETSLVVLVSGQEDPHTYEPTPSEIENLAQADVVFRMGISGVEPWWDTILNTLNSSGTWNPSIIMAKEVDMLKYDPLFFGGGINPHIWMDPNNIMNFTYKVNETLSKLDPSESNVFSNNCQSYIYLLENLLNKIDDAKNMFQDLKVVEYHPAFFYFLELLNIIRVGLIEPGPGKEPSARDIVNIIDTMELKGCKLIIYNPQHESESVYEIARNTGSKLALLTPLLNILVTWNGTQQVISTYAQMIEYNIWALANPVNPPPLFQNYLWVYLTIGGLIGLVFIVVFVYRFRTEN